jgi:hypothetical protein
MFDGFGAVLDRLQGLLGKSYLLTGFFPVLLTVLLSLPLVPLVAPESPYFVQDALDLPTGKQILIGFSLLMLVAFLGFVAHSLNPSFRRCIESGGYLFRPWLVNFQKTRLQKLQNRVNQLRPDMVNYRLEVLQGRWVDELRKARELGRAAGGPGPVRQVTLDAIQGMEACRANSRGIPFDMAQSRFQLLHQDLQTQNADALPALNRAQIQFRDLARYGYDQADAEFRRLNSDRQAQFPLSTARVGPTALANLTAAHADGILARYGMNVELFWPEIQKFAAADPSFKDGLEESKLRLDFAVAMAAAAFLYTAVWLPVLFLDAGGRLAVCALTTLGPIAVIVFCKMVVWNTQAFNATVNTAIELYRFQVLTALHCELPAGADAERALWTELTELAELGHGEVIYHHA